MADDKKNVPDAGKVDEPTKLGKTEPVIAEPLVHDQPAQAKAETTVVEDVFQPDKVEKQTTIPCMGDHALFLIWSNLNFQ